MFITRNMSMNNRTHGDFGSRQKTNIDTVPQNGNNSWKTIVTRRVKHDEMFNKYDKKNFRKQLKLILIMM
jgi:hypothetical protein